MRTMGTIRQGPAAAAGSGSTEASAEDRNDAGAGDNDGSGARPGDVVEFSLDDDLTLF